MPEPLRRRLRLRAVELLVRAPAPLARALLAALSGPARWTRFERRTLANLELALGDALPARERLRIARDVRRHTARLAFEWTRLARAALSQRERERTLAWVAALVELDPSVEGLLQAARSGRGQLLVTAHLGNWELAAIRLRQLGVPGRVVGFRKRNDPAADWLVGLRRALDVGTVPQDAPPRQLLELLRGGACVGLLADLEARRLAGEVVPFFGRPAWTMTAPAALARAARAPIVPLRCVARGARYRLLVEPPMDLRTDLDRRAAARDLAARLNALFERWIREDPAQWAWHQRRWRPREELERLTDARGRSASAARGD